MRMEVEKDFLNYLVKDYLGLLDEKIILMVDFYNKDYDLEFSKKIMKNKIDNAKFFLKFVDLLDKLNIDYEIQKEEKPSFLYETKPYLALEFKGNTVLGGKSNKVRFKANKLDHKDVRSAILDFIEKQKEELKKVEKAMKKKKQINNDIEL